jgi:hypothetical protein
MTVSGYHVQMVKCRKCGKRGHPISECLDPCLRIEMCSQLQQVAPAVMAKIKSHTKAVEVITGHNNQGPCKPWGYIRFHSFEDREEAAEALKNWF